MNYSEGMQLPIMSLWHKYEQFFDPKQPAEISREVRQNLYFSDFFQVKPNNEHYEEDSTRRVIVHEITASGT